MLKKGEQLYTHYWRGSRSGSRSPPLPPAPSEEPGPAPSSSRPRALPAPRGSPCALAPGPAPTPDELFSSVFARPASCHPLTQSRRLLFAAAEHALRALTRGDVLSSLLLSRTRVARSVAIRLHRVVTQPSPQLELPLHLTPPLVTESSRCLTLLMSLPIVSRVSTCIVCWLTWRHAHLSMQPEQWPHLLNHRSEIRQPEPQRRELRLDFTPRLVA